MNKPFYVSALLFLLLGSGQASRQMLRSAAEPDYPPFSIVTTNGDAAGFSVDLLRAAAETMSLDITFKTGPWNQIKDELAEGELDVLPLVGRTPEREALYDFTTPYLTLHGALFVRKDETTIHSLADLPGKRIAVMKGDNAEEYVLRSKLSDDIVSTTTFDDAFRMLAAGEADAVIAQKLMSVSLLKQLGLDTIRVVGKPNEEFKQQFCFAVQKGNARLLALLNEGLAIINANGTSQQLYQKWIGATKYESELARTLIYGGDQANPPFEFLDDKGQPAGFNIDLLRALSKELGIDISFQLLPWSEVRQKTTEGQLDLTSMLYSEGRDRNVDFSMPLLAAAQAVFARTDSPPYRTPDDLKTYRVSVSNGDIAQDIALEQRLGENLVVTTSPQEALQLLADGTVDFSISTLLQGQYWINKHGWKNLRLAEPRLYVSDYCYAVPEGNEALLNLINAGLTNLKHSETYRQIYHKWLDPFDPSVSRKKIQKAALIITTCLLLAGMVVILWINLLQRQVHKKTIELRKSEERFNIAADTAKIGVWDRDIIHNRLIWDDRMYRLYGIRKADFNEGYEAWIQYVHPDDLDRTSAEVIAAEHGEKSFDTEFRIIRPDGETRHIRAFGKVIRDEDGTPLRMIGTNQDVTEQIETHARFQMLFEHMNNCVAIYKPQENNSDFKFINMNPKGLRYSKLSREEVIGRNVTEVFPGVKESGVFDALQRVAQTGKPEYLPLKQYKDNRIELWVENHIFKLPSGLIVAVYEDITEKHQAEEALKKSEAEFRSTIEDLQIGVVVHDADSSIILSNPQARKLLGLNEQQLLGKKATDPYWCFVHEDLSIMDLSDYPVSRVISTHEKLSNLTLGIRHPDRSEITWVLVSAVPVFTDEHKLKRVVVNFIDISGLKKAKQALVDRNHELEKFNRASVGRELRMIELKQEINALRRELGKSEPYPIAKKGSSL